jgi:hypothetical protein
MADWKLIGISATLALSAVLTAAVTHTPEPIANFGEFKNGKPLKVEWNQPNATAGKFASLILGIASVATLRAGAKSKCAIRKTFQTEYQSSVSTPVKTAPNKAPQWDEDEEFQPEISEPIPSPVVIKQPEKTNLIQAIINAYHVILACSTQSGKTSTILGAIEELHTQTNGNSDWSIVDPKGSLWMGLEDLGKVIRLSVDNVLQSLVALKLLDELITKMVSRQKVRTQKLMSGEDYNPKPHVLILDEWPTILNIAGIYDIETSTCEKEEKATRVKSVREQIISKVQTLVFNGAEDNIRVWVVGQTHSCKGAGFSVDTRNNFGVFCLGRNSEKSNFQSIERAIADTWLIYDARIRARMQDELEQYRGTFGVSVAYTNIGGHKICQMPNLTGIKTKKIFGKSNLVNFPKKEPINEPLSDPWEDSVNGH